MKKTILVIAVIAVFGGIFAVSLTPTNAQGGPHEEIINIVTDILTKVNAIKAQTDNLPTDPASDTTVNSRASQSSVDTLQTTADAIKATVDTDLDTTVSSRATQTSVNNLQTTADSIEAKTDNLPSDPADNSDVLGAISALSLSGDGYVPFKTVATGLPATCDEAGGGSDFQDLLTIDGGTDFIVTGVLFKISVDEVVDFIIVDTLIVDGTIFSPNTGDLTSPGLVSFDIAGVALASGGNFPTTIVANGGGASDIQLGIFCNAGTTSNLTFNANSIIVSGWKSPTDIITATYSDP